MWGNKKEHLKYRWIHLGVGLNRSKNATFRFGQAALVWCHGWVSSTVLYGPGKWLVKCQIEHKIDRKYFRCFFLLLALSSSTAASFVATKGLFSQCHIHIVLPWFFRDMNNFYVYRRKKSQHECLLKVLNQWIFYHLIALRSPSYWRWQTSHWENNLKSQ